MYGETFYGRHTAQHQLQWSQIKIRNEIYEDYEDMEEILLMLQVFLAEDPEIEYLFCGAPSGSETCLLVCNDLFCFQLESV